MIPQFFTARVAFLVLAMVSTATLPAFHDSIRSVAAAQTGDTEPPSIVFIVTDDQRWDTLDGMPTVRERIAGPGMEFRNAFVVNPLCCPSRASILTGQYSHSTGVYRNSPPHGGFQSFNDSSTLPVWLSEAGYSTGLFGKYINRYRETTYVPPGWTRWVAAMPLSTDRGDPKYYDYNLNIDGTIERHGSAPEDYLTDVMADHAVSWIRETTGPLFLYFAPKAPHSPATPATRHAAASVPAWKRPPSFNESDVSDKPAWVRNLSRLTRAQQSKVAAFRADQYRTLLSVDEAVDQILDALEETGRLSTTLIVFTSDNGLTFGEHRWRMNKQAAYEESIRVPFVVRFDPLVSSGKVDDRMVLNIDLAPTAAEVAGVAAPSVEGQSFLPLLSDADGDWRSDFLIEHVGTQLPTYCAVRNERYTYTFYTTKEQELYNLAADPFQLKNVASNANFRQLRRQMRVRLRELCDPPPPGMAPP